MGDCMNDIFQLKNQSFLLIDSWLKNYDNVYAGFTTINGSTKASRFQLNNLGLHVNDHIEAVIANREHLAKQLKFPIDHWIGANQTHGNQVKYVHIADKGKGAIKYDQSIQQTDGLYTDAKGLLLVLAYADCVPIFFYEVSKNMVGIVHAGWKGTVLEISKNLIQQWQQLGSQLEDIQVAIGPSICKDCYKVDQRVINEVQKLNIENVNQVFHKLNEIEYSLDLQTLNQLIIESCGIQKENIITTNYCTCCHKELFFSHRRDQGDTGRMLGFIGIREEE